MWNRNSPALPLSSPFNVVARRLSASSPCPGNTAGYEGRGQEENKGGGEFNVEASSLRGERGSAQVHAAWPVFARFFFFPLDQ